MGISIRYPDSPQGADLSGFEQGLEALGQGIKRRRDERQAAELYEKLFSQSGDKEPMSLATLASAPRGEVSRAPLPAVTDPASQHVAEAHNASDPMNAYFTAIRSAESGGDDLAKNPNSSATGRYQFTEGTWNGLMQSNPELGLTAEGRTDPRQQEAAVRALTAGNARQLSRGGVKVNPGSLYAAHFLGAGGAVNAFGRPDQTPMTSVVDPEVMQANPFLGNMTVGDFKAWAAQKGGGQAPSQAALESLDVGESMPMGGAQRQPAQGQLSTGGFNLDPALMKQLISNPITRPLAIDVARSRLAAMQDQNDPMKQVAYQKALLEVDNLRNPKPKTTDDMAEYQYSQRDPSFAQYQLNQKRASATNVNVGSEKGYDKTVGEGYAKRFLDVQDGAQSAQRAMNALDVMEQSMNDPGFYSGTGAGAVANLKRLGAALGMEGADGIDSIETFNALSKQAALDSMGGSLGSGFSNADRDFVTGQVPTLDNSPQGNKALIGIQRKLNQRKQEVAQLARQYAQQNNGRIDAGFDDYLAQWAQQNPLFRQQPAGSGASRGAGSSTGRQRARNPQTGEELEWDGRQWSPVR